MRRAREMKNVLRRAAEARLADAAPMQTAASSESLLHELQVHQIELEIQNEALRHAQNELEDSRDRYVDLFESAPVAYVILSRDGWVIEANRLADRLLGLAQGQLMERPFEEFVAPADLERWREQTAATWAGTANVPADDELLLRNADGSQFHAQLEWVVLERAKTGRTMRITFFDITERSEAAAEIHRLAYFDPLTHLPNRRLLLDRLAQTLATSARNCLYGAILFLDLDNNISAQEFRQADFVDQVQQALDSSGASPAKLTLELTEGAVLDTGVETMTRLRQLSELGVRFSVNDFGRGWSSLSRLTRLPLQELKIDRSLLEGIDQPGTDATLVAAIITLARTLGLTTVAEGVETEAQRCFLAEQGCHTFQGFLFSHPLPLEGFERFLRRGMPNF